MQQLEATSTAGIWGLCPDLELNRIINGDCVGGMRESIPDGTIDLIVTDPPYLVSYKTNYRKNKDHKFCTEIKNDNNPDLINDYIKECYRVLKPNSAMYMFCSCVHVDKFMQMAQEAGFKIKNLIVWVKNNWTAGDLQASFGRQYEFILLLNKGRKPFNGKRITDVWFFDRVAGKNQLHQNQKPIDLIKQCIEYHSDKGDTVFDGFMGSGTTAEACWRTDRNFVGYELDKEYYSVAVDRLSKLK